MRRLRKYKFKAKDNTVRVVERFAWFPITLDDHYQVWLEKYYVKEKYYIYGRNAWWSRIKSWSVLTEQKNMLKDIKDGDSKVKYRKIFH